jgi:hypothetical protein
VLIPTAMTFEAAREYLFRTVSPITLNYRGGPLSIGAAGHVHGGDRLRGFRSTERTISNRSQRSTGRCMSMAPPAPNWRPWCSSHGVPLHVFDWRPEHEAAGLARDAIYLLRPDTYVALADTSIAAEALDRYCADHRLRTLTAS